MPLMIKLIEPFVHIDLERVWVEKEFLSQNNLTVPMIDYGFVNQMRTSIIVIVAM